MTGKTTYALFGGLERRCPSLSIFLTALFFTSACSNARWVDVASPPASSGLELSVTVPYEWRSPGTSTIAPGYAIRISSPDPKLNGTFRVDINNSLKLPHERTISTIGVDESSLQERVRATYAHFFKSPEELQTRVESRERLIEVQGLVIKPGQHLVEESASIDEVIALAGGLNEKGSTEKVRYLQIRGTHGTGMIRLADYYGGIQLLTPHWEGGERLFFQTDNSTLPHGFSAEPSVVRLIGQVKAPADYPVKPGATFFTYLLAAGGPTDRADLANITLIRSSAGATRARAFNSQTFNEIPPIEPGDTLIVNADVATPTEKSSRVAASIASVLTSLCMIAIAML